MRVLLTGSSGFIGRTLAAYLRGQGCEVAGFDLHKEADFVGSLSLANPIFEAVAEFEPHTVIHLGGLSHTGDAAKEPDRYFSTNVAGTMHVLEACRVRNARLVFVGSGDEYGAGEPDEFAPLRPANIYAATKAAASQMVGGYINTFGLKACIVRLANVYGPNQGNEKFISLVIDRVQRGQQVTLHNDGKAMRDWLYIGDACRGFHNVLRRDEWQTVYNFAGFEEASVGDVAQMICDELGHGHQHLVRVEGGAQSNRVRMKAAKTTLALDYKPNVPLRAGLRHIVNLVKERQAA